MLAGAVLGAAGVLLGLAFSRWKDRSLRATKALESETILNKARTESEMILRDARLLSSAFA